MPPSLTPQLTPQPSVPTFDTVDWLTGTESVINQILGGSDRGGQNYILMVHLLWCYMLGLFALFFVCVCDKCVIVIVWASFI